ncbi:MAG: hypothetical protein [Caudoviricetes sp.]|nr:MAG: hypothetical protein [Caudoviricetes sp.]
MYTQKDLREWVTLADVFDAHEALDLKAAQMEKAREADSKHGSR